MGRGPGRESIRVARERGQTDDVIASRRRRRHPRHRPPCEDEPGGQHVVRFVKGAGALRDAEGLDEPQARGLRRAALAEDGRAAVTGGGPTPRADRFCTGC